MMSGGFGIGLESAERGRERPSRQPVLLTRFNHQHNEDRKQSDAGESAKNHIERDVAIAQRAESPIAETAAADADKIHDSVTGGAPFRSRDLAEDRHVVAVEKSPA